jgi:hypothetical protein
MKGLDRSFCLVFLQEGEPGIDHDDPKDCPPQRGHAFTRSHEVRGKRERGSNPQQDGEEVGEMMQESAEK